MKKRYRLTDTRRLLFYGEVRQIQALADRLAAELEVS